MRLTRRKLLAAISVLTLSSLWSAEAAWFAQKKWFQTVLWKPVTINGGGFVTHLSISSDGSKFAGTDVGGAYIYVDATSSWEQICTQPRMAISVHEGYAGNDSGVADARIAWDDSDKLVFTNRNVEGNNSIWRSTDKGVSSRITNYPLTSNDNFDPNDQSGPNGGTRLLPKIGIDPNNADVIYAPNPGSFPKVSFNGGLSWTDVTGLPSTGTGIGACEWQFDVNSGTTNGRTNVIWVCIYGVGVYKSTNAGVTWVLSSGTVVAPVRNSGIDSAGTYYISHLIGANRFVSKCEAGVWSDIRTGTSTYVIAVDVSAVGKVATMRADMVFEFTTNGGSSWSTHSKASQTFAAGDSPWQADDIINLAGAALSSTEMVFDPLVANKLWIGLGQGVWSATYTVGVAPTWTCNSKGIEELVVNDLNHEAGQDLFIAVWDEYAYRRPMADLDTAPSSIYRAPTIVPLTRGFTIARDPQNANKLVIVGNSANGCGYSDNGGDLFNVFASNPFTPLNYDMIAINDGVYIWIPSTSSGPRPYISTNDGAKWDVISIPNTLTTGETGWATSIQTPKKTITADTVNPNTFYMFNYRSGQTPNCRGCWRTTNRGVDWALGGDPYPLNFSLVVRSAKAVPGYEGHLFATPGHNTPEDHPALGTEFSRTVNGGVTWTSIANMLSVVAFGIGKAQVVGGYPTIFVAGWWKRRYGIWRFDNGVFTEPTMLLSADTDTWPLGMNDSITVIEGDKDIYGRCYIGFRGHGSMYCDIV